MASNHSVHVPVVPSVGPVNIPGAQAQPSFGSPIGIPPRISLAAFEDMAQRLNAACLARGEKYSCLYGRMRDVIHRESESGECILTVPMDELPAFAIPEGTQIQDMRVIMKENLPWVYKPIPAEPQAPVLEVYVIHKYEQRSPAGAPVMRDKWDNFLTRIPEVAESCRSYLQALYTEAQTHVE